MNGKDILALLLHILLLISCSLCFGRQWMAALALAVPVSLVLFFMRFYVPLLFAVALVASLMFAPRGKGHWYMLFLGGVLMMLILAWIGLDTFEGVLIILHENFVNPFYGFARFVLTPIPFNTQEGYIFLNLSALIHWLLFPFACWGAVLVYRLSTPFSKFFLFYVLVFVSLYAVSGDLQGPRHRIQLDYAWAVFQFMGVMNFRRSLFARALQLRKHPNATHTLPLIRMDA